MARTFVVWAGGNAHVGTDLKQGRHSVADRRHQIDTINGYTAKSVQNCAMADVASSRLLGSYIKAGNRRLQRNPCCTQVKM